MLNNSDSKQRGIDEVTMLKKNEDAFLAVPEIKLSRRSLAANGLFMALLFILSLPALAQQPVAELAAETHPADDRTCWVKLVDGLNPSGLPEGVETPVRAEIQYHQEKYEARLGVTRLRNNLLRIRFLWFIKDKQYYYPRLSLRNVLVEKRQVGSVLHHPEGADRVGVIRPHGLPTAPPSSTPAPNLPVVIRPNDRQVMVISDTTVGQAIEAAVGLWRLGSSIYKKVSRAPQSLPPEKTEMVFDFIQIEGRPDVELKAPHVLSSERQIQGTN